MDVTFNVAMEDYFIYLRHKLKCTTYETNVRKIKLYILNYVNDKTINITTKDYLEWLYYITSLGFSYKYKSSLHYCFSDFLNFCQIYYNLDTNVAVKVGSFRNDEVDSIGNVWTIDEFNQFISVVEHPMYKVLFKLLFFTGMRKGELLALTWNDLNDFNNTVYVNKSTTRLVNNGKRVITTPKTRSSIRLITINDFIVDELIEYKKFCESCYPNFANDYFIFGGYQPISFTQLKRKKDYYCNLAGVKQIKIHEFRHSHACLLFQKEVPISEISHRLGHSTLSMTMDTYLKFLPNNEKRVIETLNSFYN